MVLALILALRKRFTRGGLLFLMYLMLYSVGRFVLTYFRQERIWFWGLQEAQVISAGIFVIALVVLIYLLVKYSPTDSSSEA